jgi:RNA polymerase sigma-70 factor (ECF subfamily)
MAEDPLDTLQMHHCVRRWQAGDAAAADDLFRAVGRRLEYIARKMLRGFPAVQAWTETADVLQGSLFRLLHTLRQVQPESTRHFFNLAAVHVRRELLDLARRFRGEKFARLAPAPPAGDSQGNGPLSQVADGAAGDGDLELWCRFHEAVERLPAEECEVLGLVFYHGWSQAQIAELFQVSERTIRRRWQSACLKLHEALGGELPGL